VLFFLLRHTTSAHLYIASAFHSIPIGPASTATAGGFLQVAVSKARKHATLVHSSCLFALPIQH